MGPITILGSCKIEIMGGDKANLETYKLVGVCEVIS